jgi:hypothetical protein
VRNTSLALAMWGLIVLCGCGNESTGTVATEDQLPQADQDVSITRMSGDVHLMLVNKWTDCFKGINGILEKVTDQESARRVQAELDELVATKLNSARRLASQVSEPGAELAADPEFGAAMQRYVVEQQQFFGHLARTNQIEGLDTLRETLAEIANTMTGQ